MFDKINKEKTGIVRNRTTTYKNNPNIKQINIKFNNFFNGIFSNDEIVKDLIFMNCLGLISKIVDKWDSEIKSELEKRKKILGSNSISVATISHAAKTQIINKWEL